MKEIRALALGLAIVAGLPACQGDSGNAPPAETAETTAVPDRPAPAISNPGSPSPVGTDVGTLERDTSGGPVANDSMADPRR